MGKIPILVGTDVIGRGIDFPNVTVIINYDTPKNVDDYIHRIGRTGRCGNKGKSISFINESSYPIIPDLYKMLQKNKAIIPDFLEDMYYGTKNKKTSYGNSKSYEESFIPLNTKNCKEEYKSNQLNKMSWRK